MYPRICNVGTPHTYVYQRTPLHTSSPLSARSVSDYSFGLTTLEEVFLNLSRQQEARQGAAAPQGGRTEVAQGATVVHVNEKAT